MIYVLAPSRLFFERLCRVVWLENPNDPKFVLVTNVSDIRKLLGRTWNHGDEFRSFSDSSGPSLETTEMFTGRIQIMKDQAGINE